MSDEPTSALIRTVVEQLRADPMPSHMRWVIVPALAGERIEIDPRLGATTQTRHPHGVLVEWTNDDHDLQGTMVLRRMEDGGWTILCDGGNALQPPRDREMTIRCRCGANVAIARAIVDAASPMMQCPRCGHRYRLLQYDPFTGVLEFAEADAPT